MTGALGRQHLAIKAQLRRNHMHPWRSGLNMRVGTSSAEFSRIQCLVQGEGVCVLMLAYRHNWLSHAWDLKGYLP